MDPKTKNQESQLGGTKILNHEHSDATIIAGAIYDLADAIREHVRVMKGEDTEVDNGQFDLAGERIARPSQSPWRQ